MLFVQDKFEETKGAVNQRSPDNTRACYSCYKPSDKS